MIEVQNLSKSFVQGPSIIRAVDGVTFKVSQGDTASIVGPSGSGKTTLLSLLAGLEKPDSGKVYLNGQDLSVLAESELSAFRGQQLGIVFQQFHLMPHLTALENVSLPLEIMKSQNSQEKALSALDDVGLGERATHLPKQLSGGERQRVAIARAAVVQPKILFADEPSGNLDTHTGEKVIQLLFDLVDHKEMTLVLVTHDQKLADRCQRKIQMEAGRII